MKRSLLKRKTPLKRGDSELQRTPLKRSGGLARGKRIRSRNPERRDAEWRRAYGSEERVRAIRATPSVVSGETPCENAHVRSGGTGRKADACWIVPLTPAEHRELHQKGAETFQAVHGVDLGTEARRIEALHPTRTP